MLFYYFLLFFFCELPGARCIPLAPDVSERLPFRHCGSSRVVLSRVVLSDAAKRKKEKKKERTKERKKERGK
jgi:hypothetical protein